jgi:hypothetical protein
MKRIIPILSLFVLLVAACAPAEISEQADSVQNGPKVTVYRAPT